jgi:hypothetical protein
MSSFFTRLVPRFLSLTYRLQTKTSVRFTTSSAMDYDKILQGKYPAKQHARRVVDFIRNKVPGASGVLYLESRHSKLIEDSDEPEHFR